MEGRATANPTRSGQDVRHRTTDTRPSFSPTTDPCLLKINCSIPLIHTEILAIEFGDKLEIMKLGLELDLKEAF